MAANFGRAIIGLLLLCSLCAPVCAVDGASFELISGDRNRVGRLGLQWKLESNWFPANSTFVGAYWDASPANLRATQNPNSPENLLRLSDFGVGAVFRLQNSDRTGFYAEAGTGSHYLQDYYDNYGRRQGSRLALNSHAGIGFIWKNGVDIGFRAMHISNSGLRSPNDAVNLLGMGLRYLW